MGSIGAAASGRWTSSERARRRAAPVFLGLVLGYFSSAAFSLLVDALWFYGRGHGV